MEQNEKNYDKIDDILDELDDLEDNETDLDIDDNVHVNLVKEEKKGEDGM